MKEEEVDGDEGSRLLEAPRIKDDIENSSISVAQSSFYREASTFLKSKYLPKPRTSVCYNFIGTSALNKVMVFFITVTKKRFPNIYYAYDSTSFCLVRSERALKSKQRYIIYGKLTKNRFFFLESLKEEEIDYKELCYMLL
ncbi:hypothetical protein GINT2_002218 [Glugoides intestinalis]